MPFTPGRLGGGRDTNCVGLFDLAGVGESEHVWMLF